jgi:transcriptional antiterminator NusG
MTTSFPLYSPEPARFADVDQHRWYALRVKSRFEFVTSQALKEREYVQFLPSYRVRNKWTDRTKEIDVPLFPGYVFCRFDASDPYPVLNLPGVVHVVSAGRTALPLDEREIAAIQAVCHCGLRTQPWPFLQVGRRVVVERGPLAGTEGIVTDLKNEYRLIVSLTLLQRSVATEIDREWIRPL